MRFVVEIPVNGGTRRLVWEDGKLTGATIKDNVAAEIVRIENRVRRGLVVKIPVGPVRKSAYLADPYTAQALIYDVFGGGRVLESDVPPLAPENTT